MKKIIFEILLWTASMIGGILILWGVFAVPGDKLALDYLFKLIATTVGLAIMATAYPKTAYYRRITRGKEI